MRHDFHCGRADSEPLGARPTGWLSRARLMRLGAPPNLEGLIGPGRPCEDASPKIPAARAGEATLLDSPETAAAIDPVFLTVS